MRLDKLKRVSKDYLGAVDGCTPFIGKYSGPKKLAKALTDEDTSEWMWKSLSASEAEYADPLVIFFAKHEKLYHQNVPSAALYKLTGRVFRDRVVVAIYGVLINNILFMQDKYKTENFNFDFSTDDEVEIKHLNAVVKDCYVAGYFNLQICSYYCDVRLD